MNNEKDIRDDEIRIIGDTIPIHSSKNNRGVWIKIVIGCVVVALIVIACWALTKDDAELRQEEPTYFEPQTEIVAPTELPKPQWLGREVDSLAQGFCEIRDTTINDIALRIYIPHNAELSLHIGRMDKEDSTVIYTAQAADVRADNGGIVGAFVLAGEPKAWGLSKQGFCASIEGTVTIGVAEYSPLFEQATEKGGYFFRQYPLVDNGVLVENNPKNKSIRRSICDRRGEIFMVETLSQESFHDFAQALVDLGVDNAIYLVGSNSYGWAIKEDGTLQDFGDENRYKGRHRMPKNTSYIVWRRK
jgi:hypothetical protein